MDATENVIVDLSPKMIGMTFGIPGREEVLLTIEEEATSTFKKGSSNNIRHINEAWLEEPRKTGLKATYILRADFKEAPKDIIIMLSRAFGKIDCKHYHF